MAMWLYDQTENCEVAANKSVLRYTSVSYKQRISSACFGLLDPVSVFENPHGSPLCWTEPPTSQICQKFHSSVENPDKPCVW